MDLMDNTSGYSPVEFNVIVKQDDAGAKTKFGLIKPDEVVEREKHGQTQGVLVALSPLAFNADIWPADMPRPEPGARVAFARHAGTFVNGLDGVEYRVVKDKDIVAVMA
jgi:co-chaperonin GroES (HSP10)